MFLIRIPIRAVSWNVLARKSHWTYTRVFKELQEATLYALREARPVAVTPPVRLIATAFWRGKRKRDISNIVLKPIEDMLVQLKILPDDSCDIITEVVLRGEIGAKEDMLILELQEFDKRK